MENTPQSSSGAVQPATRFTLLRKLIIGYSALALFVLMALFFSSKGLYTLNLAAREIATNHLPAISTLSELRNVLISQEGYAGKYAIFRSDEFRDLFRKREAAFLEKLAFLKKTGPAENVADLEAGYARYRQAADRLFAGDARETTDLRTASGQIFASLDQHYTSLQRDLHGRLETANRHERQALFLTMGLSLTGLLLAFVIAVAFTYRTFSAVRKLQQATHRIAAGDFSYQPKVQPGDELGDLADDFRRMAVRLKELEQLSLDASPLTRLPGNIAIEQVIEKRLREGEFALCYADLDNFKAFGDRYGYAKGSELIRLAGEIIDDAVKANAGGDAFVGHIGGDDFVMVLDSTNVVPVCEAVIKAFDAEVPRHYTTEDLARGGIQGPDRYGVERFFPLMTISIAAIISSPGEFSSSVELARTAAEIKDFVKEKPGSNYLLSRQRREPRC